MKMDMKTYATERLRRLEYTAGHKLFPDIQHGKGGAWKIRVKHHGKIFILASGPSPCPLWAERLAVESFGCEEFLFREMTR